MAYNLKINIFYKIYGINKIFRFNGKASNLDYRVVYYDIVYLRHLRLSYFLTKFYEIRYCLSFFSM
jgi:hypothetical protein